MTLDFKSTKRASGVGLGLGVAMHVATAHGGSISAESSAGQGSVFRLELPRIGSCKEGENERIA